MLWRGAGIAAEFLPAHTLGIQHACGAILDPHAGRLDGFALLEVLRKMAPATQAPALVVSSSMELRNTAFGLREKLGGTA